MNLSKPHNIRSLKNKNEIKDLLSTGEKVFTKYGIIFLKNAVQESEKRYAILIKKNTGNAVKRNYSKRLIRYFINEHAAVLKKFNRIIFLYLYKGKLSYPQLKTVYLNALKKYEENTTHSH